MNIDLYYPDGNHVTMEHYNPKLRGSKLNGVRAAAIVISLYPTDKLDEDFFETVILAETVVTPTGFVGVERVW